MKRRIFHIYSGTSGTAGLYLHPIYTSLKSDFDQEVFVNYYYPFQYGRKIFYRFSELSNSKIRNNKLRRGIRLIEQVLALTRSLFIIIIKKPDYINYSLTSDTLPEYCFLRVLSFFRISILITCHDVKPFVNDASDLKKAINKKKKFFTLADKLIIHNKKSLEDLKSYYSIDNLSAICFRFPVMDLSNIKIQITDYNRYPFKTFLFIGYLRKSKGINILIEAWNLLYKPDLNCKLIIAGNNAFNDSDMLDKIHNMRDKNCELISSFLSNEAYYAVIKNSDFIVLPYIEGTNSGIPSSVVSLDRVVLTSDIDMFNELSFIQNKLKFKSGDKYSLQKLMEDCINLDVTEYNATVAENRILLKEYENNFEISIKREFNKLLQDV